VESAVRAELGQAAGSGRSSVASLEPPAFVYHHPHDLTPTAGRQWACVVVATASYLESNALRCAGEVASRISDSMELQQELEAWASKAKGGKAGGLSKSFSWLEGIRAKWDTPDKLAELLQDTERLKDSVGETISRQLANLSANEDLEAQTQNLAVQGKQFQASAKTAKQRACMKCATSPRPWSALCAS